MAKSMADKYRAILAADPGSMVFVELAKALIDQGEFDEAIDTCRSGVDNHPDSIVGYVLWGRSLLGLGDPEAAMDQFDKAVDLDPENPYAYNLIGEALLAQSLYRSALPLLRKAVSLQPGDARVRQWLEQAERAVGEADGTSDPRHSPDPTTVSPTVPEDPADVATGEEMPWEGDGESPAPAETGDLDGLATEDFFAGSLGGEAPPVDGTEDAPEAAAAESSASDAEVSPAFADDPFESAFDKVAAASSTPALDGDETEVLDLASVATSEEPPPEGSPSVDVSALLDDESMPTTAPGFDAEQEAGGAVEGGMFGDVFDAAFGAVGEGVPEAENGIVHGMTAMFSQLEDAGEGQSPLGEAMPPEGGGSDATVPYGDGLSEEVRAAGAGGDADGVHIVPGGPGVRDPTVATEPPPLPPPLPGAGKKPEESEDRVTNLFGLDLPPPPGSKRAKKKEPKVVVAPPGDATAQAMAAEYERELRAKLMPSDTGPSTFIQRHSKKLLVAGGVVLALSAAVGATLFARSANRDETIKTNLAAARNGIARDSYQAYIAALAALEEVLDLDEKNVEAKALTAEVEAILFSEFDHDPGRQSRAGKLVSDAAVVTQHPDAALDARYHLMTADGRAAVGAEVLEAVKSRDKSATLHYLAGRHLLATGNPEEATKHFEAALEAEPGHARTVLELGRFLASRGRWKEALQYFDNARTNFPGHIRAQVGAAEAKLHLGQDLDAAMESLRLVEKEADKLAPEEVTLLDHVMAQLLDASGDPAAAVRRLEKALAREPKRVELAETLARLHFRRFELDRALPAVEKAVRERPADAELMALEADILMAWSRYDDVLDRLSTAPKSTALALRKGMAAYFEVNHREARQALDATRNEKGQMPADAAIFLALVDLESGEADRARAVIDRAAKVQGDDPLVQWALGRVELTRGNSRGAIRALRRAIQEDPSLYRANTDLARAHLADGKPARAMESVSLAVETNPFHREGLLLLGGLHLRAEEFGPARDAFKRVLGQRPADADANRGLAESLLGLEQPAEAAPYAQEARSKDPKDSRNHHAYGRILLAEGKAEEASKVLLRARRLDPESAEILTDLGWAYLARGGKSRAKLAQKYFSEALDLDRRSPRAQWGLGRALLAQKDRDAPTELKRATSYLKKGKDADLAAAFRDLAEAYMVSGSKPELSRARNAALDAIRIEDTAETRTFVGSVLLDENKAAPAKTHLQKAIELDPGLAEAHYHLGRALAEGKESAAARESIQKYLDLEPKGRFTRDAKRLLSDLTEAEEG